LHFLLHGTGVSAEKPLLPEGFFTVRIMHFPAAVDGGIRATGVPFRDQESCRLSSLRVSYLVGMEVMPVSVTRDTEHPVAGGAQEPVRQPSHNLMDAMVKDRLIVFYLNDISVFKRC
jgi:hypothetical protein